MADVRTGAQRRVRSAVAVAVLMAASVLGVLPPANPAAAHETGAYSHDPGTGRTFPRWMTGLPDQLRLSDLSIPGTHDSGAYEIGGDSVETQTMSLAAQLRAGIRAWDIRLGYEINALGQVVEPRRLVVYHGFVPQFLGFETHVLQEAINFLGANPGETIIMRIKHEHGTEDGFVEMVEAALARYGDWIYTGGSTNPTLAEMRGKIVVLRNYGDSGWISWGDLEKQDSFRVDSNWDLYDKWLKVKEQLVDAQTSPVDGTIYVNFLSAAVGSFPYFIASGHSSPQTGAPNLWTGISTTDATRYADFPREDCAGDLCSIYFEGTNVLTMEWLRGTAPLRRSGIHNGRVGIVMADFPGAGLISEIINLNPWNWPPEADAAGPYVADEGSEITFTAAGSTDRDGDPLEYRWRFHEDEGWTTWSSTPTATRTWADDWTGAAVVDVRDHTYSDTAEAPVTVRNVAPVITAEVATIDEDGVATVTGTITDPGIEDTFSVVIDWGEGAPETFSYGAGSTSFSETHQYLDDDPTGTPSDTYAVTVTVTDDDGGTGRANAQLRVDNVDPVTTVGSVRDETGALVGTAQRVVLPLLEIDLSASFTDVGTRDTHTARVDWRDGDVDDLGPTTGALTASHVFTSPGLYEIQVPVTDDDTGTGTGTWSVTVVDAAGAMQVAVEQLQSLAAESSIPAAATSRIERALGHLTSQAGGTAANGALSLLEAGQLVAALEMLELTILDLEGAEANGAPDLTGVESLLALIAKSITLDTILRAEAVAARPPDWRRVAAAKSLVGDGDGALSARAWATAVDLYQQALRGVHPLVLSSSSR